MQPIAAQDSDEELDEDEISDDECMDMDDDEDLTLDPIHPAGPGQGDASSSTSAQEYKGIGKWNTLFKFSLLCGCQQ